MCLDTLLILCSFDSNREAIGMSMMHNLKEQNLTLMVYWMGTPLELGLELSTDFYYSSDSHLGLWLVSWKMRVVGKEMRRMKEMLMVQNFPSIVICSCSCSYPCHLYLFQPPQNSYGFLISILKTFLSYTLFFELHLSFSC